MCFTIPLLLFTTTEAGGVEGEGVGQHSWPLICTLEQNPQNKCNSLKWMAAKRSERALKSCAAVHGVNTEHTAGGKPRNSYLGDFHNCAAVDGLQDSSVERVPWFDRWRTERPQNFPRIKQNSIIRLCDVDVELILLLHKTDFPHLFSLCLNSEVLNERKISDFVLFFVIISAVISHLFDQTIDVVCCAVGKVIIWDQRQYSNVITFSCNK